MQAMVLEKARQSLVFRDLAMPRLKPDQILIRVRACGVCRTDLHVVDGELTQGKLPIIPGHEIVGDVCDLGGRVEGVKVGDYVGVPWLGWTCGTCHYCRSGQENLCDEARFTGYQLDGGYSSFVAADWRYCFKLPPHYSPVEAAPLMCAGLIGYRSLRMAGDAHRIGLYGFGAAAHILAQIARWQGREVFAFTRSQDMEAQRFALSLGAAWAGSSDMQPPSPLDAAIIFAPVGALVPVALRAVRKGGIVVCAGIHMSTIPAFSYDLLWGERVLRSVANLTRRDAEEFLAIAPLARVRAQTAEFPLSRANEALAALREGRLQGAAVLVP
ncbi:MAG: zinc-dependent alcohol dehydrogenase family protein [Alphaproteobacteria bacterium]